MNLEEATTIWNKQKERMIKDRRVAKEVRKREKQRKVNAILYRAVTRSDND